MRTKSTIHGLGPISKITHVITALITILVVAPTFAQIPTVNKNYVEEITVKVSGKTLSSQLVGLPVESANRNMIYVDGIGRLLQTIKWQASPNKKDVVNVSIYDAYGRQTKKLLPYAEQSSADGSYKPTALSNQSSYYANGSWDNYVKKTNFPFEVSKIELSELNRLKERGFAGQDWQPVATSNNGHTFKYDYEVNSSSDAVKLWSVNSSGASSSSYPVAKLYKNIIGDENWQPSDLKGGTVEEFTDFKGRLILKRVWETNAKSLSTYYVYDNYDNLRYILPPSVNENGISPITSFTESQPVFTNFIYGYKYDGRNRVIEKKIPGKTEWDYFVYNKLNQVVLSQDGKLRASNQWIFLKYDVMGREVVKGIYMGASQSRADLQLLVDNQTSLGQRIWELRDNTNSNGTGTGYTNDVLPKTNIVQYHLMNYYDDYAFYTNNSSYNPTVSVSSQLKGLPTGIRTNIIGSGSFLLKVMYYDTESRLLEYVSDNHLAGKDRVVNSYSFAGELMSSTRTHQALAATTTIAAVNLYDHVSRKYRTKININNQGETILNQLGYNEIGQVRNKALHSTNNGASFLQQLNYGYNDRGWLAKINDPDLVSATTVFGLEVLFANNAGAYNGNVGGISWQTMVPSGSGLMQAKQNFVNGYDKLDRLQLAKYSTSSVIDKFNEEIAYDVMGNVSSLKRKNSTSGYLNSLTYDYNFSGQAGNRLSTVTDAGSAAQSNSFTYDVNGNQKTNSRLLITDVSYNFMDLPQSYTKSSTGEVLNFTYTADGVKLKKQLGSNTTDYVDGIQYVNNTISFIRTEEGRAVPGANYEYEYFIQDHLGNTRATVKQNGTVIQIQDYYAFGMEMDPGNSISPSIQNNYKLSGKEKQGELGLEQYDFGARMYDPMLGRWTGVDALTEKYNLNSPYSYGVNNPLTMIDPDGNDPTPYQQSLINKGYNIKAYEMYVDMGRYGPGAKFQLDMKRFRQSEVKEIRQRHGMDNHWKGPMETDSDDLLGDASTLRGMFNRVVGSFLMFTPFGSVGALAKAGRDQNYAAGAVAFLGLAGELGAIASLGSRGTAVGKTFSSRALGSNAEGGITTLADYYPPNGGALGKWNNVMAKEGQVFSRYGPTTGRYASDVGLPFSARALPHEIEVKDYFEFQAIRPFMMQSSSIGPGFGKIGFGTQYKMPTGIDYLREFGYIKFLK